MSKKNILSEELFEELCEVAFDWEIGECIDRIDDEGNVYIMDIATDINKYTQVPIPMKQFIEMMLKRIVEMRTSCTERYKTKYLDRLMADINKEMEFDMSSEEMKEYEVTIHYYKTVTVKANTPEEAKENAHMLKNVVSEGHLTACSEYDEIVEEV